MADTTPNPNAIINCHTHIFIGANVPPYIGKQFIFWPFYKILSVPFVLVICKWWYTNEFSPYKWRVQGWYKKLSRLFYEYRSFIKSNKLIDWFVFFINFLITYHALIYFFQWITGFFIKPDIAIAKTGAEIVGWLKSKSLFYDTNSRTIRAFVIIFTILFIEYGRRLLLFLLKSLWKFLAFLPDKKTIQFIGRYINIGRFAYYDTPSLNFTRLKSQYPEGSGFVILPMDMEFMEGGSLKQKGTYDVQMQQLADLKLKHAKSFFPFVFIDPRRQKVADQPFFTWQPGEKGSVVLGKECFIKEYIEDKDFNGFKIYPALGYYPFDEVLLPLWKYAADHQIPITTHCIKGTIFYRGSKKKEWNNHPVFKQAEGDQEMKQLFLPQVKNVDFINNFTHPLNYLCLLNERLLRVVVSTVKDIRIQSLFGYTNPETPLTYNLENLKLCFGHYGGDDEWQKYFENDRDSFTSQLITSVNGIIFIKEGELINTTFHRLELLWRGTDWFSIISSMMMQYQNVYADISYIIHKNEIVPLLNFALNNEKLKPYILFGTDFYVVRNHKSEKEMLAQIQSTLTTEEFDTIARVNTATFLKKV